MPGMKDVVREHLSLCVSAFVLLLTTSRIFAFSGYNLDTALLVIRERGAGDVALVGLLELLPSLFCTALLYGTLYIVRRNDRANGFHLAALGLVVGYCYFIAPWTLAAVYAALTLALVRPFK